jgi:hypothetical protein
MITATIQKNIFIQYLEWYFCDVPRAILKAWGNNLIFNLKFFSIGLLLKTFFSPWHRYQWSYPRGFDFGKYAEVFFSNMISRILGAVVRIIFILLGLVFEFFIFLVGAVIFLGWFLLPFLLILGLSVGIKLVFFPPIIDITI